MTEYRYPLHGDVDTGTAPHVRLELHRAINAGGADLVIDCTDLTFIDSTGIAVLLEANRLLEADGRNMLIVNVGPGPRRVFEGLGLKPISSDSRATVWPASDTLGGSPTVISTFPIPPG